jgi:hypothetical protein
VAPFWYGTTISAGHRSAASQPCWQPVHMSEFLIARPDIIFGKDRGIYPSPEAYRQAATWNGEFGQMRPGGSSSSARWKVLL